MMWGMKAVVLVSLAVVVSCGCDSRNPVGIRDAAGASVLVCDFGCCVADARPFQWFGLTQDVQLTECRVTVDSDAIYIQAGQTLQHDVIEDPTPRNSVLASCAMGLTIRKAELKNCRSAFGIVDGVFFCGADFAAATATTRLEGGGLASTQAQCSPRGRFRELQVGVRRPFSEAQGVVTLLIEVVED